MLDLTQLRFIDSSAIQVVLELQKRSGHQNARLTIVPDGRAVRHPFELLGLTATLPFLNAADA